MKTAVIEIDGVKRKVELPEGPVDHYWLRSASKWVAIELASMVERTAGEPVGLSLARKVQ